MGRRGYALAMHERGLSYRAVGRRLGVSAERIRVLVTQARADRLRNLRRAADSIARLLGLPGRF